MTLSCTHCRFFFSHEPGDHVGECRHDPPVAPLTYQGRHDDLAVGVWPRVFSESWCGEFQPRIGTGPHATTAR